MRVCTPPTCVVPERDRIVADVKPPEVCQARGEAARDLPMAVTPHGRAQHIADHRAQHRARRTLCQVIITTTAGRRISWALHSTATSQCTAWGGDCHADTAAHTDCACCGQLGGTHHRMTHLTCLLPEGSGHASPGAFNAPVMHGRHAMHGMNVCAPMHPSSDPPGRAWHTDTSWCALPLAHGPSEHARRRGAFWSEHR